MSSLVSLLGPIVTQLQSNTTEPTSQSTIDQGLFTNQSVHPRNLDLLGNGDPQSPIGQFLKTLQSLPLTIIRQLVNLFRVVADRAETDALKRHRPTIETEIYEAINGGEISMLTDSQLDATFTKCKTSLISHAHAQKMLGDKALTASSFKSLDLKYFQSIKEVPFISVYQGLKVPFKATVRYPFEPTVLSSDHYVDSTVCSIDSLVVNNADGGTIIDWNPKQEGKLDQAAQDSIKKLVVQKIGAFAYD
jgi:hypothetical protein